MPSGKFFLLVLYCCRIFALKKMPSLFINVVKWKKSQHSFFRYLFFLPPELCFFLRQTFYLILISFRKLSINFDLEFYNFDLEFYNFDLEFYNFDFCKGMLLLNCHTWIRLENMEGDCVQIATPNCRCPECGKDLTKRSLPRHMQHHTGNYTHRCQICQKGFIEKHHLVKHIKTHHPESLVV